MDGIMVASLAWVLGFWHSATK